MSVGGRITVGNTIGSLLDGFDSWFLVCINVEFDEQEQIARQDTASKQGSCLCACAVPDVWQFPKLVREAGVGCKPP